MNCWLKYFIAKEHGFNLEFKCQNACLSSTSSLVSRGRGRGGGAGWPRRSLPPSCVCKLKILKESFI